MEKMGNFRFSDTKIISVDIQSDPFLVVFPLKEEA